MSNNIRYDLLNNKEWLIQKYVEEKLSTIKIAKMCNCKYQTIIKYLVKNDIEIRSISKANNPNAKWELLENEKWLYKKYIEERLTTYEIAKICNCGGSLIGKQLKKFNIETRSQEIAKFSNIKRNLLHDKDWLRKQYVKKGLSTTKIAKICNCKPSTISRYLKKFNIEIRSGGSSHNPNARWDLLNNKRWLYKKYVEEKLSTIEIAKVCNCSNTTISRQLKSFNIEIRLGGSSHNPNVRWDLLNNKRWLYKKYIEEKLSTIEIAKFCNCDPATINNYFNKFNIEIRSNSESRNPNARWGLLNNKRWLYKKYVEEKLSTIEIAKVCNCSNTTISRQLKSFNIEIRSNSESQNPTVRWDLLNNKRWLYKKYVEERLSTYQIAKICNCGFSTVNRHMRKFNISIREMKGENHPQWKGGISFEPYCIKFNKELKEHIRDKFEKKCFLCKKLEEDNNNRKLSIHHINYNKMQGCGHKWSLIPLCSSCHTKTNNNRHYWFNLLNNYWLLNSEINFNQIIFYPIR